MTRPRRQRVAAYAEIRDSTGRLLLVRSTDEIGGKWFLPGGGIGFAEGPEEAVHREVEEETGLLIHGVVLRFVVSDLFEWRGEDVHSVRLIYAAQASDPDQDLRHETDGSTVRAEWVDDETLTGLPLAGYVTTYLNATN
jgi:8-oxo-dGTP diphosphatase